MVQSNLKTLSLNGFWKILYSIFVYSFVHGLYHRTQLWSDVTVWSLGRWVGVGAFLGSGAVKIKEEGIISLKMGIYFCWWWCKKKKSTTEVYCMLCTENITLTRIDQKCQFCFSQTSVWAAFLVRYRWSSLKNSITVWDNCGSCGLKSSPRCLYSPELTKKSLDNSISSSDFTLDLN